MAAKLDALAQSLPVQLADGSSYVPHISQSLSTPGQFEVADRSSVLFDQLSLVWGAARVLQFLQASASIWPDSELPLASALETGANQLLSRAIDTIALHHVASDGAVLARWPVADSSEKNEASTVDLGLLLAATREALACTDMDSTTLLSVQARALSQLESRQGSDGRFAEVAQTAGVSSSLTAQFAGMYGLLAVAEDAAAMRTFDFLEAQAWDGWNGFGLYRLPESVPSALCYSSLDMGLAVGALRELADQSHGDAQAVVIARLSAFARTIVDEAGLQLDNAGIASRTEIASGNGRGTIFGLRTAASEHVAPVLQRSLCLDPSNSDSSCGGLRVLPDDPWYQTDIAMYASYILNASDLGREDDADANLIAVIFHSGLGLPFSADASLSGFATQAAAAVGSRGQIDPIFAPYYGGDPYLGEENSSDGLAWDSGSFDERIIPSALGMTLLRESQEVLQLATMTPRSADEELTARTLAASAAKKVTLLETLVTEGPNDTPYIPHSFLANPGADGFTMKLVDPTSDLFDQASLLLGLCEVVRMAQDDSTATIFASISVDAGALAAQASSLIDVVLDVLETAHRRNDEVALADEAEPDGSGWVAG